MRRAMLLVPPVQDQRGASGQPRVLAAVQLSGPHELIRRRLARRAEIHLARQAPPLLVLRSPDRRAALGGGQLPQGHDVVLLHEQFV